VGVEMGAPAGQQMAQSAVGRPGRPVGAVPGERVPHVDHNDDPGGQRDPPAGVAAGVAVAVGALMVLADDLEGPAQRRSPPDDVGADHRMLLDPAPLLLGEGARLVEHVIGMSTLPTSCR
jgi:hypothetical protein